MKQLPLEHGVHGPIGLRALDHVTMAFKNATDSVCCHRLKTATQEALNEDSANYQHAQVHHYYPSRGVFRGSCAPSVLLYLL